MIPTLVAFGLVAGFAREILLAFLFGTSRDVEVFRVAFGLPSILSDSLAISFVAVLIPIILQGETNRPAKVLRRVVWASVAVGLAVFVIGLTTMPMQARLLAPGITGADRASLIMAGRICWGTFLFVIMSLPLRALMSTRNRVWPGASSQIMRSGGFTLAMTFFAFGLGWTDVLAPSVAAMLGGATVLLVHVIALGPRDRKRLRRAICVRPPIAQMSTTLAALSTVFLTQLLLSGGRLMDRATATNLGEGMLASLEYSYALLMAVGAVMGTSTNLVLAPRLGRALRDHGRLSRSHWGLILGISALSGLIGLALTALAQFIVPLVYQYGAFDDTSAALTIRVFRIHALALGPLVLALLLTQVLLLQGRQRLVVWASVLKITVKVIALWLVVRQGWGIEGIAASLIITELAMAAAQGALFSRWFSGAKSPLSGGPLV